MVGDLEVGDFPRPGMGGAPEKKLWKFPLGVLVAAALVAVVVLSFHHLPADKVWTGFIFPVMLSAFMLFVTVFSMSGVLAAGGFDWSWFPAQTLGYFVVASVLKWGAVGAAAETRYVVEAGGVLATALFVAGLNTLFVKIFRGRPGWASLLTSLFILGAMFGIYAWDGGGLIPVHEIKLFRGVFVSQVNGVTWCLLLLALAYGVFAFRRWGRAWRALGADGESAWKSGLRPASALFPAFFLSALGGVIMWAFCPAAVANCLDGVRDAVSLGHGIGFMVCQVIVLLTMVSVGTGWNRQRNLSYSGLALGALVVVVALSALDFLSYYIFGTQFGNLEGVTLLAILAFVGWRAQK